VFLAKKYLISITSGFIYDIDRYLKTLEFIRTLDGYICIPSHAPETTTISTLVDINKNKVLSIIEEILKILEEYKSFEELLKELFYKYHLTMNSNQYVLVGSTVKSYLSYLYDIGKIEIEFRDNMLLWKAHI
jgi:hypothetical protein